MTFLKGYVCPKGVTMADVHEDPDRVRHPLRRTASGDFERISWNDAFELAASRLQAIKSRHGADSVALYWGNPTGHSFGTALLIPALTAALGTRNRYSAGSGREPENRRLVSCSARRSPFPCRHDRTSYFLCIGANPIVSNNSVMTAPDMRGRMRAVRNRGGKVVVVDPAAGDREGRRRARPDPAYRRTFLFAMVQTLVEEKLVDRAPRKQRPDGTDRAPACGVRRGQWRLTPGSGGDDHAWRAVRTRPPVAYSRVVCIGPFATLATYATDLLNITAGRLGRTALDVSMPPIVSSSSGADQLEGSGAGSRVRGLPGRWEPTVGDARRRMATPGDGQIRALVTVAGNPVLSAPNGRRIAAALEARFHGLGRHLRERDHAADLILPPAWGLADDHVDVVFAAVAVRNFALVAAGRREQADELHDWEILLGLCERLGGGPTGTRVLDRIIALAGRWLPVEAVADRRPALEARAVRRSVHAVVSGLSLAKLKNAPHGIDLGPLRPGHEQRLYHSDGKIHLAVAPSSTTSRGWNGRW